MGDFVNFIGHVEIYFFKPTTSSSVRIRWMICFRDFFFSKFCDGWLFGESWMASRGRIHLYYDDAATVESTGNMESLRRSFAETNYFVPFLVM